MNWQKYPPFIKKEIENLSRKTIRKLVNIIPHKNHSKSIHLQHGCIE